MHPQAGSPGRIDSCLQWIPSRINPERGNIIAGEFIRPRLYRTSVEARPVSADLKEDIRESGLADIFDNAPHILWSFVVEPGNPKRTNRRQLAGRPAQRKGQRNHANGDCNQ